jgi:hypothetical protein
MLVSLRYIFDFPRFCSEFFKRLFELPEEAEEKSEQNRGRRNVQVEGQKGAIAHPNVIPGRGNARDLSLNLNHRGPDSS